MKVKMVSTTNPRFDKHVGDTGTLLLSGIATFLWDEHINSGFRTSTIRDTSTEGKTVTITTLNSTYVFEKLDA